MGRAPTWVWDADSRSACHMSPVGSVTHVPGLDRRFCWTSFRRAEGQCGRRPRVWGAAKALLRREACSRARRAREVVRAPKARERGASEGEKQRGSEGDDLVITSMERARWHKRAGTFVGWSKSITLAPTTMGDRAFRGSGRTTSCCA